MDQQDPQTVSEGSGNADRDTAARFAAPDHASGFTPGKTR